MEKKTNNQKDKKLIDLIVIIINSLKESRGN